MWNRAIQRAPRRGDISTYEECFDQATVLFGGSRGEMCPHTNSLSIEGSVFTSRDARVRMNCVGRRVVQTHPWERTYEEVCVLETRTMFAYVHCSLMELVGASKESCDAS